MLTAGRAAPANAPDLVALGLSATESDLVELLLVGLTRKEIAERLSIAPETARKHTRHAHRKLGVQNRVQLSFFVPEPGGQAELSLAPPGSPSTARSGFLIRAW